MQHLPPNVKHKGINEKVTLSETIIKRVVDSMIPGLNPLFPTVSQDGSSMIGAVIYYLTLGLLGKTIDGQYKYQGTPYGDAIFDAGKIIRYLLYFFINTLIVIFFKDVELLLLEENHTIDDNFFNLSFTLKDIHKSLTNGLISFIYTTVLENGHLDNNESGKVGGANRKIDTGELIKDIFITLSFNDFRDLLLITKNDPYELTNKEKDQSSWKKSFTHLLYQNHTHDGKHHNPSDEKKKSVDNRKNTSSLRHTISNLGNIPNSEITDIINLLEQKKEKTYTPHETGKLIYGGAKLEYITPIEPNKDATKSPDETNGDKNAENKTEFLYYKLYLLECLLNSDRFLESFVVMFNLVCRIINRLIKKIVPLIRRVGSKTFQNVGAFIFSLGGPFTEILWFGFTSVLTLADMGGTVAEITDDFGDLMPKYGDSGYVFEKNPPMIKDNETKYLDDLFSLGSYNKRSKTGGGCCKNHLKSFETKIKEIYLSFV